MSVQGRFKIVRWMLIAMFVVAPAAEFRWSRRADDGVARTDGHDLRAKRRGHQPLAEGTDGVARLRERRECADERAGL